MLPQTFPVSHAQLVDLSLAQPLPLPHSLDWRVAPKAFTAGAECEAGADNTHTADNARAAEREAVIGTIIAGRLEALLGVHEPAVFASWKRRMMEEIPDAFATPRLKAHSLLVAATAHSIYHHDRNLSDAALSRIERRNTNLLARMLFRGLTHRGEVPRRGNVSSSEMLPSPVPPREKNEPPREKEVLRLPIGTMGFVIRIPRDLEMAQRHLATHKTSDDRPLALNDVIYIAPDSEGRYFHDCNADDLELAGTVIGILHITQKE